MGKWLTCKICHTTLKIRAPFSSTEWLLHRESAKHKHNLNNTTLKNNTKVTTYFKPIGETQNNMTSSKSQSEMSRPTKRCKVIKTCPGFAYGKNSDLLPLYHKYKREDDLSNQISIVCQNGRWTIHSVHCTNEWVNKRNSLRSDKNTCDKCF